MNKIFKVIWSKSRNCYVVASELAKGTSKSTSTGRMAKRAALAAVAALLLFPVGGYSYATINSATINGTSVITGTQKDADNISGTVMKATNNARDIGNLKTAMQSVETELAQHQSVIDNLGTDKLTLSSDNTLQKESYDSTTKTTTKTDVTGLKVAGSISAESASISGTLSAGGAVNAGSVNSRGNITAVGTIAGQTVTATGTIKGKDLIGTNSIISQGTIAATGNISSQATVGANEIVSQTNITAQNQVVGMQGVIDNTLTSGNYVTAGNTVGENIVALDTQVKANADAIAEKANAADVYTKTDVDNKLTADKTSTALHISSSGDLIVGTKENQTVKNMEIRGQLTSGSISTGDITSSGDVSVAGKVEAEAVYDDTTKTGNYVVQTNSVGANLSALDTQVKSNADAITAEATAREAGDTALNERITNVKEYLEKQTSDNYVSKTDAAVQDGAVVKAANTIGENVTNLDAALAKETAARIGADAAQDKVIQQVNDNLVQSVNTINKNMADGFTALNQADANEAAAREAADAALDSRTTALEDKTEAITYDKDSKTVMVDGKLTATEGITDGTTQDGQYVKADNYVGQNLNALDQGLQAETSARVAADTKLVEAVNSGLSLSDDNVLQKNTTTIDAQGNVTTSKTDANEMILNKGNDNQITLNENGIKVGTNSTVVDKDGVYTGGDTYSEAKAALKSDGSIKGADGKFTVNSANGTVNVNDQIELNGATGVVKSNGLNVGDGNMTVSNNGNINTVGTLSVADGNFKVNGNGGVSAAGGKTTLASDGSIKAADGKFTVNSNGGVKAADGKITLSSDGSVKAADGKFTVNSNGAVKAANGNTTIDSNGNLKTAGTLSAADGSFKVDSNGKITSTGLDAGNGTIQTTGTVQAGDVKTGTLETTGDATIGGNLTVDKNLTVNGEFNAKTLSSKLDENNYTEIHGGNVTSVNSKVDTTDGKTYTSTSTLTEKGKTETASNGINRNVEKMDATESSDVITNDANGQTSTFKQRVDEILNQINSSDTVFSKVDQKVGNITSEVTDGTNTTSSTQTTTDITNTAASGTITNEAQKLVNKASDTISNEATNDITNTSTNGDISNTANNGTISNTAKNIENTASENITNTAKNGSITNDAKNIANIASETLSNSAKNITNTTTDNMTNTIGKNLTTTVGGDMSTEVTGNQTNTVKGTLTETVTGKATENYNGGLETTITGEEKHTVNGTQTNNITGDQTNTIGGNQTTTVTGDSSLTAENINNTASNKITNKALDVETDVSSSIVNKVSNDAGSNTSTQLSYQTKEEMSQADGKTASYLRGAAEEKSQLTDGDKKTTIDTIAGQTNTNITEGTNTSNSLQKADQIASSVTDGTNTTVVNQDATSLASSITDGTKSNNTNNTVDKSEQLIKASDTQYSATTKTATKMEDAMVSGSSIIDVIKNLDDAANPLISSAVTDGTNSTGITQTAKDITNTAKNGTITNDAKDITNTASETLSNSAKNITNSTTEDMTNTIGRNMTTTVGGNMSTEVTGSQSTTVHGNQSNTVEGTLTETVTGKATENYNGGLETTITGEEKHTVNGSQTNEVTGDQTNTIGGNQTTTVTGDSSLSAKNISNTAATSITNKVGDNVSTTMSTDSIVNKVGKTTITTTDGKTKLTNEDGTHETEMDYATVLKDLGVRGSATVDQNLTVKGDSDLQGNATVGKNLTVNGTSDLKGDVTMESNATVKKDLTVEGTTTTDKLVVNNGATVTGGTTTDTLHVTNTSTFDGAATFKDVVTMEKDLSVGGNASVSGSMTASSYKVGDKTYIDDNGINANNQKITNVAAGELSANSLDAVNGSQLYETNRRVSKMDSRINEVGANAAAMANLHPLEFDADSKFNVAAAVGNYKNETATALGLFYRPNEDVMVNLSGTVGSDDNMIGGGVSVRIGRGGNKARNKQMAESAKYVKNLESQVNTLQNQMDALLSVLNPNMSKEFPDVPANHWAYEAVSRLAGNGIIQGYEDGKYHGERTMTRYEMAEIIYKALQKGAKAEAKLVEEFKPELKAMAAQNKA